MSLSRDASGSAPPASFVVTGGAHGIGAAITARLARRGHVVVIDPRDAGELVPGAEVLVGDAGDPSIARDAIHRAAAVAPLAGWVNNAAIFHDARMPEASAEEILDLVTANLRLAVVGAHAAIAHWTERGSPGAIVDVSSHQAQRPVRGALPYATAKAAVEGLTRALAVDHGPDGIRVNAVALGSISTPRYEAYRAEHPGVDAQMAALHPLGRVGAADEVAAVVDFLLSDAAAFISGAILPVDGGRSAQGADPEAV